MSCKTCIYDHATCKGFEADTTMTVCENEFPKPWDVEHLNEVIRQVLEILEENVYTTDGVTAIDSYAIHKIKKVFEVKE